ncbi:MAG: radical SAM protein [Thermodesulfobacteriota bacterium]
MCLTVPAKVLEVEDGRALLSNAKGTSFVECPVTADLKPGDWVLHVNNLVIKKIPAKDAKEILDILEGGKKRAAYSKLDPVFAESIEAVKGGEPGPGDIASLLDAEGAEKEALFFEANSVRGEHIKDFICIHGIIEFSNYCSMDCAYCGLSVDNAGVERFRMEPGEIIETAVEAVEVSGYKLLVLQSGEDPFYTDEILSSIIEEIKKRCRCFIFISVGERGYESYKKLKNAGASGVLFRFETANQKLFKKIHPHGKDYNARFEHLRFLRELGFFIATGSLVGLPGQTTEDIAGDILAISEHADMATIGPFVPAPGTPLGKEAPGDIELSLKATAIIRLLMKKVRVPVVTALETLAGEEGRRRALTAGANSLMINLTPDKYRSLYSIYPKKFHERDSVFERYGLYNYKESFTMLEKRMAKEIEGRGHVQK